MRQLILKIVNLTKKNLSRQEAERRQFSEEVRSQLLQLKDKGLAIPIFTL